MELMKNKHTVMVHGIEIPIAIFKGERVLTLRMIDALHEWPDGAARKAFVTHRVGLVCGVHYWKARASDIRAACPGVVSLRAGGEIVLITKSGYERMVKPLADMSWQAQRVIDLYFVALSTSDTQTAEVVDVDATVVDVEEAEGGQSFETVEVAGQKIRALSYKGQRVVTFGMIDELHGRPDGTARGTHHRHRENFIEDEDIFTILDPLILSTLGFRRPQGGVPGKVVLLTESGYFLIVKSLQDKLAWKIYRELVRFYFLMRNEPAPAATNVPATFDFNDPIKAARWMNALSVAFIKEAELRKASDRKVEQLTNAVEVRDETIHEFVKAVGEMAPKAEAFDQFMDCSNGQPLTMVAKYLKADPQALRDWMLEQGILYRLNKFLVPKQSHITAGHFVVGVEVFTHNDTSIQRPDTRMTTKGIVWLGAKWGAKETKVAMKLHETASVLKTVSSASKALVAERAVALALKKAKATKSVH